MIKAEKSPKEISIIIEKIIKDVSKKFKLKTSVGRGVKTKSVTESNNFKLLPKDERKSILRELRAKERQEIKERREANTKIKNDMKIYVINACDKQGISHRHIIKIMNLDKIDNTFTDDTDDDDI